MTKIRKALVLSLVAVVFFNTVPMADGQTKFSTWFRERVGERTAKDAAKAQADAKWQLCSAALRQGRSHV